MIQQGLLWSQLQLSIVILFVSDCEITLVISQPNFIEFSGGRTDKDTYHETTFPTVSSGVVVGKLLLSITFDVSGSSEIATENDVPLYMSRLLIFFFVKL